MEFTGRINLKDSDICMEFDCVCGANEHFDGGFLHYYQCSSCHTVYGVEAFATFTPLEKEEVERIENERRHIKHKTV